MHQVSSSGPDYAVCIKYEPVECEDEKSYANDRDNEAFYDQQYNDTVSDNLRNCSRYGSVKYEVDAIISDEGKVKSEPIICETQKEPYADEEGNQTLRCDKDDGHTTSKCDRTKSHIQKNSFTFSALNSSASDKKHASTQVADKLYKCDASNSTADSTKKPKGTKHRRENPFKCEVCHYSTPWPMF